MMKISAVMHAELPHSNSFMSSVWKAWPGCGIGSARSENSGARGIQAPHCQGHGHRAGTEATIAYQTFTVWEPHETVQAGRARRTYTIHNPEKFACPPRPIANGHGRRDEGTEAGKLLSTRSQGARCAGPLSLRVRVRDIGAWITALQKEHEPNPKL